MAEWFGEISAPEEKRDRLGAHRAARLLNRTAVGRGDGFRASDRSRGRESYTAGHGLFGLPVVLAGADWLVELSASFARHSPAFSALP